MSGPYQRGANPQGARLHNERLVLNALRARPHSQAELTRHSGLSAQAISRIVRGLSDEGLIRAGAPVRGRVGQPSVPLSLAADGAWFAGLAIGRRSSELVLIDFQGCISERRSLEYRWPDPDDVLDFVNAQWPTLVGNVPTDRLHGLGIAQPGYLWEWPARLGTTAPTLQRWRDRDLPTELGRALGVPVFTDNDATAACGAELTFGTACDAQDLAYVYIGHIVGGGLVVGGELQHGPHGNSGAFGPLPVRDPDDPQRRLQLMDAASLHVLEDLHDELELSFRDERANGWTANPDVLSRWLRYAGATLAQATLAVASIIDIEAIVIDGPFPTNVRDALCAQIRTTLLTLDTRGLRLPAIVPGSLGSRAPVLGAARQPLFERFLIDQPSLSIASA